MGCRGPRCGVGMSEAADQEKRCTAIEADGRSVAWCLNLDDSLTRSWRHLTSTITRGAGLPDEAQQDPYGGCISKVGCTKPKAKSKGRGGGSSGEQGAQKAALAPSSPMKTEDPGPLKAGNSVSTSKT